MLGTAREGQAGVDEEPVAGFGLSDFAAGLASELLEPPEPEPEPESDELELDDESPDEDEEAGVLALFELRLSVR